MATYKTPGVYVEEIATLPPSVAQVATAIPAFIGYTEKGSGVARIDTLLDYETRFGKAKPSTFTVTVDSKDSITGVERTDAATNPFLLHYSLSHYFQNGGGSCYIVSVGNYATAPAKANFDAGLGLLEKEDEPTLILFPDAVSLEANDYYALCQKALGHCKTLADRFALLDVPAGDVAAFRSGIGMADLMYGAAYYPYLNTLLNYQYQEAGVAIGYPSTSTGDTSPTLASIKSEKTALYNQIKLALGDLRVVLPPSPAMAGVYVRVDRERGVWKAPANESVSSVVGPVSKVSDRDQEDLNIDPTGGKSINAIRDFVGRGTLVWGARTLDGNSNEWRYVPVRRLFITIEESIRKASAFAVFEPNDATTWLKVKAMVESYLYGLWQQGALAGSKPEDAYLVKVGLGTTMTSDDVLAGRMIVEVGVAPVRPAEFIILRFTQQTQTS